MEEGKQERKGLNNGGDGEGKGSESWPIRKATEVSKRDFCGNRHIG